jgi:hypothetical protein
MTIVMRFTGIAVLSHAGAVSSNGSHLAPPQFPKTSRERLQKTGSFSSMMLGWTLRCFGLDLVPPFALDARPPLNALRTEVRHRAMSEKCHNRKWTVLLNHLVGERQQGRGHGYAELFSGLQIDHQSKLARLLDRKIAGLGAAKNFRNIGARMAPAVQKVT